MNLCSFSCVEFYQALKSLYLQKMFVLSWDLDSVSLVLGIFWEVYSGNMVSTVLNYINLDHI